MCIKHFYKYYIIKYDRFSKSNYVKVPYLLIINLQENVIEQRIGHRLKHRLLSTL
jgi:hypothetical protein